VRPFIKFVIILVTISTLYACQADKTNLNNPPDYSQTSTEDLQRLHKKGDIHATFTLGFNHLFKEDGNPRDNVTNVDSNLKLLETAHNKGHMQAHSILSSIYEMGLFGINKDPEKADRYNLEGAERGSNVGKLNYGLHNLNDSSEIIANRAHDYLIEIAADELLGGIANEHLTQLYYFGNNVYERDIESARLFAENCVIFGDSQGWCEFILARDLSEGWSGDKDEKRSAKLFLESANIGEPRAMWHAGMNALNGTGVEKNEIEAFNWVKRAAEAGNQDAMISLGVMYALGQGTNIDYEKSYASYTHAAKLGSSHAIRSMSGMHCQGHAQNKDKEICFSGIFLAMEHGDDQAPTLIKDWFVISDSDIEKTRKSRPPKEAFWTEKYPWLLERN